MLTILKKSNTIASRPGQQVRPVFVDVDAEPGRDRQLQPQLGKLTNKYDQLSTTLLQLQKLTTIFQLQKFIIKFPFQLKKLPTTIPI